MDKLMKRMRKTAAVGMLVGIPAMLVVASPALADWCQKAAEFGGHCVFCNVACFFEWLVSTT